MENELLAALLFVISRGVLVEPVGPGWRISLAPDEEAQTTNDDRPEGWIGGLGGS